ncbi:PREDICTED: meiotic recombination protein SPO11-1 [Erythranthe guttata]|uniref:meiotic recombination protein SPO11-1 n=1 Tax=Erythranthe guttata TaxID=4155 RepID=UPI00064DBD98|nr:PREDICTED: meiotic recombination protein SPO11-1 [Erythranthe guttata]|eukprot:XP_012848364.1 PREDICTED: meiotic recombination protein SPO11-1 [Erythranthe guttata]
MEGKHSIPNRLYLLTKIKELTRSLVEDLCNGRSPTLKIDQFTSYCSEDSGKCNQLRVTRGGFRLHLCSCCSYNLPKGKEILTLRRESQSRRFDALLRVLLIVQQLLQENKHGSKRDIYYMHPSVFKEQSVVDRAVNDICILLQCSRHNLNVVSVGNGLVMGWVRFAEAGRKFDCISSPNTAHQIPVYVEDVEDIISVAEYILIVEKESVFQRLANDQFCRKNRCIVITGRGYPDVPTRRFLHLLIEKLRLPVYCLVDCDPYGIDILATFRFGSMQMAYDAKSLRLPEIQWLGAFPSDCEKYQLPQHCLLPLTTEDKQKAEGILHRCYVEREAPSWRYELQLMLDRGVKFEIEALSVHSLTFLSENYLPSKIQMGAFI